MIRGKGIFYAPCGQAKDQQNFCEQLDPKG